MNSVTWLSCPEGTTSILGSLLKSGQRRALLKFEQFVLKFDRGAPSLDPEDLYAVPTRPPGWKPSCHAQCNVGIAKWGGDRRKAGNHFCSAFYKTLQRRDRLQHPYLPMGALLGSVQPHFWRKQSYFVRVWDKGDHTSYVPEIWKSHCRGLNMKS